MTTPRNAIRTQERPAPPPAINGSDDSDSDERLMPPLPERRAKLVE